MKNKKWLLLLIIALPSALWLLLETSTIHSYKLNYFGPKQAKDSGDTLYYKVSDVSEIWKAGVNGREALSVKDEKNFPFYALMFVKPAYREEAYRLSGLWEHLNYKKEKVGHIPVFLVTVLHGDTITTQKELEKLSDNDNINFVAVPDSLFRIYNTQYFKGKPVHIDYSFFVLIDNERHIRGYYDGRYASEIKRLIDEYKHLRLKEEKKKIIEENEIKTKD
jgi:hypothetical protein